MPKDYRPVGPIVIGSSPQLVVVTGPKFSKNQGKMDLILVILT